MNISIQNKKKKFSKKRENNGNTQEDAIGESVMIFPSSTFNDQNMLSIRFYESFYKKPSQQIKFNNPYLERTRQLSFNINCI
jgi:hypothetical protein